MGLPNNLPPGFYQNLLSKMASTSVDAAFQKFITKEIVIAQGYRTEASNSHNALREFLREENQNNHTFPVLLKEKDADFLGGSFGRETKIHPLDDIDIYFPLDGHALTYSESGIAVSHKVVSDGKITLNPLLTPRWQDGQYISPKKLVAGFAEVLKRRYTRTEIKPNGASVSVYTTIAATGDSDGLCYDVVPCFYMKHPHGLEAEFYVMPDGDGGWMRTNPRIDDEIASKLQRENNETYKKVVRLLKYWNKTMFTSALASYYIELSVAKRYRLKNLMGHSVNKISEGLTTAFASLHESVMAGDIPALIDKAPAIKRGDKITAKHLEYLGNVKTVSNSALSYENAGDSTRALDSWKAIFGDSFEI